ncbi:MAG: alkaline phosphatase family protein [Polyangiaceae bacterium]|nr:alkaline phosphatase family protein [Polyangiaceae bacterium]
MRSRTVAFYLAPVAFAATCGASPSNPETVAVQAEPVRASSDAPEWNVSESSQTATPIRHVVIIFDENRSFDHYFGAYPHAANLLGEHPFHPKPGTPAPNGLSRTLLTRNPNSAQPFRFAPSQAKTCDQNHDYDAEQLAFDHGLMDKFVEAVGTQEAGCDPRSVMGYFDGNTVTALWQYAQHFAISDNFFGTTFGPSMVGAINLASGQTHGVVPEDVVTPSGDVKVYKGTLVGNEPAKYDDCATESGTKVELTGKNIGDLLNAKGVTWGWFADGFRPDSVLSDGTAVCSRSHAGSDGNVIIDYDDPDPFEYYASTANPHHLPPSAPEMIGKTDQANHQYDITDFFTAAEAGHAPAVSFLRPPEYEDGHPEQSDPLAEQRFLVETLNRLQRLPQWSEMAVFITWDESDGWYDHQMSPIVNPSQTPLDGLTAPGQCGAPAPGAYPGRCGYGPRIPLVVVSPFARTNSIDGALTDQTSIIRFVEDNWGLGRIGDQSFDEFAGSLLNLFDFDSAPAPRLFLDPETGNPVPFE